MAGITVGCVRLCWVANNVVRSHVAGDALRWASNESCRHLGTQISYGKQQFKIIYSVHTLCTVQQ